MLVNTHGRSMVPPASSVPDPMEQALCDVVADPESGITRVRLCAANSESVARVERLAHERGLATRSACSPSLHRGWILVMRPEIAEPS